MTGRRTVVQDVTDVAIAALEAPSPHEGMRLVTDTLLAIIGADNVIYHEFEREGWSGIHGVAPAAAWDVLPLHGAPTVELGRLHPAVSLMTSNRVADVFTLSDLVSERTWRSSEMVSLLKPVWGKTLKLHLPAGGAGQTVRGWAATRNGSDYTAADLDRARAVQPILNVVARHYAVARSLPHHCNSSLTPREQAVIQLLAGGLTAHATARRLGISEATVNKHRDHAYRKLGVHERVSAVARARQLGLLAPARCVRVTESVAQLF